jgi:hypothetical protein
LAQAAQKWAYVQPQFNVSYRRGFYKPPRVKITTVVTISRSGSKLDRHDAYLTPKHRPQHRPGPRDVDPCCWGRRSCAQHSRERALQGAARCRALTQPGPAAYRLPLTDPRMRLPMTLAHPCPLLTNPTCTTPPLPPNQLLTHLSVSRPNANQLPAKPNNASPAPACAAGRLARSALLSPVKPRAVPLSSCVASALGP